MKNYNFDQIVKCDGSCTNPISLLGPDLACKMDPYTSVLYHAKCRLDWYTLLPCWVKNCKFDPFCNYRELLYPIAPSLPIRANVARESKPNVLHTKFTESPLRGEKPKFGCICQLQHSVVAAPREAETKLNAGAQLETFPYPTVSETFLHFNALMA